MALGRADASELDELFAALEILQGMGGRKESLSDGRADADDGGGELVGLLEALLRNLAELQLGVLDESLVKLETLLQGLADEVQGLDVKIQGVELGLDGGLLLFALAQEGS